MYENCVKCTHNKGMYNMMTGAYPCGLSVCVYPNEDVTVDTRAKLQNDMTEVTSFDSRQHRCDRCGQLWTSYGPPNYCPGCGRKVIK